MSTSGAELAHPHSLFMLGDHHHNPDGTINFTSRRQQPSSVTAPVSSVTPSGPVVQGPTDEFSGGGPIGLTLFNPKWIVLPASDSIVLNASLRFATSRVVAPDPPPPRY